VHGKDKSLNLKLHRRMVFTSVRALRGKVILTGLVTQPFTTPPSEIVVRQRLTCRKQRIVARLHPDSNGRFRVTLRRRRRAISASTARRRSWLSRIRAHPTSARTRCRGSSG